MSATAPAHPCLAPWVELHTESVRGGRTVTLAVNSRDGEAVSLDAAELQTLQRADGSRSADELGRAELFAELFDHGFLTDRPPTDAAQARPSRRARIGRALVRQEVNWSGADPFVSTVHRRGAVRLFGRVAVRAQCVVSVLGLAALVWIVTGHRAFHLAAAPWEVPVALALNLVAVAVHELGHAVVLSHFGRHVRAIGFRLHLGAPTFYVDSVDGLLLTRRQRLLQAAAGPWAEWWVTSLAAIAVVVLPAGDASSVLARFVVANAIGIALNLMPFVGLDGSWLLADLAGVPDLRQRTPSAVRAVLRGEPFDGPRWPYVLYAAANGVVAAALLAAAGFFWYQLFGGLLVATWSAGPLGALTVVSALGLMALPVLWRLGRPVGAVVAMVRELVAATRFRTERRWRVRSILRLREVATGELDEHRLGVLAGRLGRCRLGRRRTALVADVASWVLVVRGAVVGDGATSPIGPGGLHRLAGGEVLRPTTRRCTLVLLPGDVAPH